MPSIVTLLSHKGGGRGRLTAHGGRERCNCSSTDLCRGCRRIGRRAGRAKVMAHRGVFLNCAPAGRVARTQVRLVPDWSRSLLGAGRGRSGHHSTANRSCGLSIGSRRGQTTFPIWLGFRSSAQLCRSRRAGRALLLPSRSSRRQSASAIIARRVRNSRHLSRSK